MHEITDQVVELGAVLKQTRARVAARDCSAVVLSEKVAAVEKYLTDCLTAAKNDSWLLALAARSR